MGHRFNKKKFKDKNRRPDFAPKRNPVELLESVNENKDRIIRYVNEQQSDNAQQCVGYHAITNAVEMPDEIKRKIIDCFDKNNVKEADYLLDQLRESQTTPESLGEILSDIANEIRNRNKKIALLEEAFKLDSKNSTIVNRYAYALTKDKQLRKAFNIFEIALKLDKDNVSTLYKYGLTLSKNKQFKTAIELFERALKIDPFNHKTLTSYGNVLAKAGKYEKAFRLFEESLAIKREDVTLKIYATALRNAGEYEKAFRLFKESLALKSSDSVMLNSCATALATTGEYEKAFELFEESLAIKRSDSMILNSYARALANVGNYKKAFELFEESLALKRSDSVTLTSYATALGNAGEYEKAFELFEESLALKRDNSVTLNSYGQALIQAKLPNEAIEKFKESLKLNPDDSITLFLYGIALQMIGEYQEAVDKFERVKLEKGSQGFINFIYLTIGNLYYALRNKQEGNRYFDLAIGNSESSDADKLRTAKNILAVKPYDEQAVNILKEIIKTSPYYSQALKALSLNSDDKGFFEQHKGKMTSENSLQDTASLNRALYHKIQNEIAILKEILHEIITDTNTQDETLLSVQKRIHIILEEIRRRRNIEAAEVHKIPMDDYEAILLIVSKTAHDIVDFVGNEIATIKEYIWDKLSESNKDDARRSSFQDLYKYIQSTLAALNDLKSVNEGIRIKNSRFKIKQLFETWQHTSKIRHAALVLNIKTPEEEIKGDEQKIKGFINELVENSLKHNADKNNLQIKIIADVSTNPNIKSFGKRSKFPSDRKYLHIQFSDNGKGIPKDKKDWVFLPLTTTAKSNEGSGLGLFTIKKTIKEMRGYIEENGVDGVNFDIYIPYGDET